MLLNAISLTVNSMHFEVLRYMLSSQITNINAVNVPIEHYRRQTMVIL